MLADSLVGDLGCGDGLRLQLLVKNPGFLDGGLQLGAQGAVLLAGLSRGPVEHLLAFLDGGAKIMQGVLAISTWDFVHNCIPF